MNDWEREWIWSDLWKDKITDLDIGDLVVSFDKRIYYVSKIEEPNYWNEKKIYHCKKPEQNIILKFSYRELIRILRTNGHIFKRKNKI